MLRQISKDSRDGWWDWKELCLRGHIILTNDGNMICSLEIVRMPLTLVPSLASQPRVSMRVWKVGGGKGRKICLGTTDRNSGMTNQIAVTRKLHSACQYHRYSEACDYISIVSDGFFFG